MATQFVPYFSWDTFVTCTLHSLSGNGYCIQCLQGESTVAKMWRNSGLEWSLFVPSAEVQTFISNRKLDWLENVNALCFVTLLQGKLTSLEVCLYRTP